MLSQRLHSGQADLRPHRHGIKRCQVLAQQVSWASRFGQGRKFQSILRVFSWFGVWDGVGGFGLRAAASSSRLWADDGLLPKEMPKPAKRFVLCAHNRSCL